MKISVTEQHIKNGLRGSCSSDPICLALRDHGFMRPWVSPDRIRTDGYDGGFMRQDWKVTDGLRAFMYDFDNQKPVAPFTFELEGLW